jgi:hypothetical protein
MRQVGTSVFSANLFSEGSWGARSMGKHSCEMTMFLADDGKHGHIDFVFGENGYQYIGLLFDGKELVDYDGTFSLPQEAVDLIRRCGFTVSEDFE